MPVAARVTTAFTIPQVGVRRVSSACSITAVAYAHHPAAAAPSDALQQPLLAAGCSDGSVRLLTHAADITADPPPVGADMSAAKPVAIADIGLAVSEDLFSVTCLQLSASPVSGQDGITGMPVHSTIPRCCMIQSRAPHAY